MILNHEGKVIFSGKRLLLLMNHSVLARENAKNVFLQSRKGGKKLDSVPSVRIIFLAHRLLAPLLFQERQEEVIKYVAFIPFLFLANAKNTNVNLAAS
jgi:hypothetical protein